LQASRAIRESRSGRCLKIQALSALAKENSDDNASLDPLTDDYTEPCQRIAKYLLTLEKPENLSQAEFRQLVRSATNYTVRNRQLWRNASKSYPPRLVIDDAANKTKIIKALHDKTGHAGRESTFHRVAGRYYWEGCWKDIRDYVLSCKLCQHRSKLRLEEALHPSRVVPLFHCVGVDVVKLPECRGYNGLVILRDDFSGWPEAEPVKNPTSAKVARFLWNTMCRHGVFFELKLDGGSEFKGAVILELEKLGCKRRVISALNPKANGASERGHQPIINALLALTRGGKDPWVPLVPTVLLADRTTTRESTGYTPFYIVNGREAVLPVETEFPTWRTLPWDQVHTKDKLIEMRARMLQMRDEDIEESRLRKERHRKESQAYFDENHQLRKKPIHDGDLVLTYDIQTTDVNMSNWTKLEYRWLGPYRVVKANQLKGYYVLEELDGTPIRRSYAGNRVKKFVQRNGYWFSMDDEEDELLNAVPVIPYDPEQAFAEEEAARRYAEIRGTQEEEKNSGVIVRVTELPQSERDKYVKVNDHDIPSESDHPSDTDEEKNADAVSTRTRLTTGPQL
jgi:hypothetical protein